MAQTGLGCCGSVLSGRHGYNCVLMRAAAIVGPGIARKNVELFQQTGNVEWSSAISRETEAAVIFGGDGTIHHQLASLAQQRVPTLIVPCGSGNDFARALQLRNLQDSLNAWRTFLARRTNVLEIDLGVVRHCHPGDVVSNEGAPALTDRYFCCVAGVGIDAAVAQRANRLPKWLRAHGGYALSAPREFLHFAPFPMKIEPPLSDGFKPSILAAIANAPAYGGGMKIAPHAKFDDGTLDVCIVRAMSPLKMFCLFPTVYFGGHLGFREVEYAQAERVRVETEYPLDVYADGEYVCRTPVEFCVARNALRVIVPR